MKHLSSLSVLFLASCLSAPMLLADGISMTSDYHFTTGKRYVLDLSNAQIVSIEKQRKGNRRLFDASLDLSPSQILFLKSKTGKTVSELKVFEKGWNDCGCFAWSIASRFSPSKIEVSTDYLVETAELKLREEQQLRYEQSRKHWWQFWRKKYPSGD